MIRHIFKIIWNERKTNAWITLEYVLVFCVLWFCVDYLFYMGKCYFEPNGFDIEHTYQINMQRKPAVPHFRQKTGRRKRRTNKRWL